MNINLLAFILTILAGMSTMIGTIIIFVAKKKTIKILIAALAFAAGNMLTVSLLDLLPESLNLLIASLDPLFCFILALLGMNMGIIVSFTIESLLPKETTENKKIYRVGLISMIAIILHNIPEGIATFMSCTTNIKLGITLFIAISMHNIPEGISISMPLYYSTKSKRKALLYTFISGISEPFGALITFLFLKPFINNILLGILFSIIAGIMIHISLYELLPTSIKYKNNKITIFFFILGSLVMLISHIIF